MDHVEPETLDLRGQLDSGNERVGERVFRVELSYERWESDHIGLVFRLILVLRRKHCDLMPQLTQFRQQGPDRGSNSVLDGMETLRKHSDS